MSPKEFNKAFCVNLMQLELHLHPFVKGHFKGASGNCILQYFDKDAVLANVVATNRVAAYLVQLCAETLRYLDCVIGMAPSASQLAAFFAFQWMTRKGQQVVTARAEKKDSEIFIRHTFLSAMQKVNPLKVLVVADAVTTGGSARKLVDHLRSCGFEVVGVVAVCEHEKMSAEDFGVPFYKALVTIGDKPLAPQECPKCCNDIPHDKILGHG